MSYPISLAEGELRICGTVPDRPWFGAQYSFVFVGGSRCGRPTNSGLWDPKNKFLGTSKINYSCSAGMGHATRAQDFLVLDTRWVQTCRKHIAKEIMPLAPGESTWVSGSLFRARGSRSCSDCVPRLQPTITLVCVCAAATSSIVMMITIMIIITTAATTTSYGNITSSTSTPISNTSETLQIWKFAP